MKCRPEGYRERAVKSLWHVMIATVGVYELRNHKTKVSKVLACGLIAFHADAAICDALDTPTLFQRILYGVSDILGDSHVGRRKLLKNRDGVV